MQADHATLLLPPMTVCTLQPVPKPAHPALDPTLICNRPALVELPALPVMVRLCVTTVRCRRGRRREQSSCGAGRA